MSITLHLENFKPYFRLLRSLKMLNKSSLDKLFLPRFMLFTYLEVQKSVYFCVKGQNSKQNRKGLRLVGICQRQLPGEDQGRSPGLRSLNFLIQLQM